MSSLAAPEAAASSSLENEIEKAVAEGKGWKEGEKEEYLKRVAEEDHPMFSEKLEVGGNRLEQRLEERYRSSLRCDTSVVIF